VQFGLVVAVLSCLRHLVPYHHDLVHDLAHDHDQEGHHLLPEKIIALIDIVESPISLVIYKIVICLIQCFWVDVVPKSELIFNIMHHL